MPTKKNKTYIIAEIGINYNGSFDNCLRLIDVISASGADAVKLQIFEAKHMYPRSAGKLNWKNASGCYSYDIYSACEDFEFPKIWIKKIMAYCCKKGVDFLASVSDEQSLDAMVALGLKCIKIPSYSCTNLPLIGHAAACKLPIVLSTGGASLAEVEDAVNTVNKHHNMISLLHCSIKYPTALGECNLGVIKTLQYAFPANTIGYSDHTKEISAAAVQAVCLGAGIIEKHVTLDKKMKGPDHFFSLESNELKRMVQDIRTAEVAFEKGEFRMNKLIYGKTAKITYAHEKYLRDFAFMKLFAKRNIKSGERIKQSDILILRPGKKEHGLDPKYINLFKEYTVTAKKNIDCEDPITWRSILG